MTEESYLERIKRQARNEGRVLEYEDPEIEEKYWRIIELFESILRMDFNSQAYYFGDKELKKSIRFRSAESLANIAILMLKDYTNRIIKKREKKDG